MTTRTVNPRKIEPKLKNMSEAAFLINEHIDSLNTVELSIFQEKMNFQYVILSTVITIQSTPNYLTISYSLVH